MKEISIMCYLINGHFFVQNYLENNPPYYILGFFFTFFLCDLYTYLSTKYFIYEKENDMTLLFFLIVSLPFTLSYFIISLLEKTSNVSNNFIILIQWIITFNTILNLIQQNLDYYSSSQHLIYSKLKLKIKSQSFLSNNEECIICLDNKKSKKFVKLGCNHIFHQNCFQKWMLSKNHFQDFKCILCSQHIYKK